MSAIGEASAILGVVTIAGEAVQVVARSYHLIERYKEVDSRATRLLSELEANHALLSNIQRLLSRPLVSQTLDSGLMHSIYAGISQCQATSREIELAFLPDSSGHIPWQQKIKHAARKDSLAKFEQRVHRDWTRLVQLLEPLKL
jgi:hypothetical protein